VHTDEYEISLSRELAVCRRQINSIRKSLSTREKRHAMKTASFVEQFTSGKIMKGNPDFDAWMKEYEALTKWEKLFRQYESALRLMKI
jgi:hypothetical protein